MSRADLRRLRRELARLAERAARERWTLPRLEREIDRVFRSLSLGAAGDGAAQAEDTLRAASTEAEKRFVRLRSLTATAQAQRAAARVVETAGRDVTRLSGRLRTSLMRDLETVLRRGGTTDEARDVVRRRTRQAEHAVRAVADTSLAALDRAVTQQGDPPGQRYRYTGPPADRDFCRDRLGEAARGVTYTQAQIRDLDNGQALPADLYAGGYNCRHRWTAV